MVTGVAAASPAAEAGLPAGDVILKVDGKPVEGPGPLQAAIEVARVGEPLALTVDRDGQVVEVAVRPEPQPDRLGLPGSGPGGIKINVPGVSINVPGPASNIGPAWRRPDPRRAPAQPGPGPARPRPASRHRPPSGADLPARAPPCPGRQETAARTPARFPDLGLRLSEPTPALIRRFRFDREPRA